MPKVMPLAVAEPGLELGLPALDRHTADGTMSPVAEAPASSMIPGTRWIRNETVPSQGWGPGGKGKPGPTSQVRLVYSCKTPSLPQGLSFHLPGSHLMRKPPPSVSFLASPPALQGSSKQAASGSLPTNTKAVFDWDPVWGRCQLSLSEIGVSLLNARRVQAWQWDPAGFSAPLPASPVLSLPR